MRESLPGGAETQDPAEPPRTFEVDGRQWVARLAGSGRTGGPSEPGAPLIQVTFHPDAETEPPARELILVGTTLQEMTDPELAELLARSRAYREPQAPAERPPRRGRGRGRGRGRSDGGSR